MPHERVDLKGEPGGWIIFRTIDGSAEQAISGSSSLQAIYLLDQLLIAAPGTAIGPGEACKLTVHDRDRILAVIYKRTFGDKIKSTIQCEGCEAFFDLDFSLSNLIEKTYTPDRETCEEDNSNLQKEYTIDIDGTILLSDGLRMRPPTGEDEIAVAGLTEDEAEKELFQRCLLEHSSNAHVDEGGGGKSITIFNDALKTTWPLISMDLKADCPECGHQQDVHFDIQDFLLNALVKEQSTLNYDIHCLASAYGWGLEEILSISREQRRSHVALIESDTTSRY